MPHHIIRFVEYLSDQQKGDLNPWDYIHGWGPSERIFRIKKNLLENPQKLIQVVFDIKRDFVCARDGMKVETDCVSLTNRRISGCGSGSCTKQEKQIAAELGINKGRYYPFCDLQTRVNTMLGKAE